MSKKILITNGTYDLLEEKAKDRSLTVEQALFG